LKTHFIPDASPPLSATMITAFNDESLDLDCKSSEIEEQNAVLDEFASPLQPLPSVATNAPHDFIKLSSIEPSSIELLSFEPSPIDPSSIETMYTEKMSIESIYSRTYDFIEPSPVHNHFRKSIRSIINQFRISEFGCHSVGFLAI
jgi:hypothetical protein